MNTLKQMGIQQWRLKNSHAAAVACDTAVDHNVVVEPKVELSVGLQSSAEQTPETSVSSGSTVSNLEPSGEQTGARLSSNPAVAIEARAVPKLESGIADPYQSIGNALADLDWQSLQARVDDNEHCPSCGLGNTLLGSGNANAVWMFVTDAPTSREVSEQIFAVGRAGQLFDAMLGALGLSRADVYFSSIFKCAPTADLHATPQCSELVHRQIELVVPKVVVTFGEFAAQAIIKANENLESLRRSEQRCLQSAVDIVPTYSPAQMLNEPSLKAKVWVDLKKAAAIVG